MTRLPLLLLAALVLPGSASAYPELWMGLRTPALDPQASRLLISGEILDTTTDGAIVRLAGVVTMSGPHHERGGTVCQASSRCTLTPPTQSPAWQVDADARLVYSGPATLPAGGMITIAASDPATPRAGAGLLAVHGALTLSGTASLTVTGAPRYLPLPLITAYTMAAAPAAGSLPPGTALELHAGPGLSILYLVEAP